MLNDAAKCKVSQFTDQATNVVGSHFAKYALNIQSSIFKDSTIAQHSTFNSTTHLETNTAPTQ